MNVAIFHLKDLFKMTMKLIILIISFVVFYFLTKNKINTSIQIPKKLFEISLYNCTAPVLPKNLINEKEERINLKLNKENIMASNIRIFKKNIISNKKSKQNETLPKNDEKIENKIEKEIVLPQIPNTATTERIKEKNLVEKATNSFKTVKIKNQSKYSLTEDILSPNVEIENKKDILIFHTHTCESYTPCEEYPYTMTGNYRTTDGKFSVVRVGDELEKCLKEKGFNVTHDKTLHDYPSYSGSYERSQATVENLLKDKDTEIVIDLHRDAVGAGDTYGPSIMINGEKVAQIMFVIGTDGGGLEHPNWQNNLKIAVKIQEKANEMYPGLFRPIVVRNSRYNQHLAKGACLIEVGATANTLKEALLSMQCLANVMAEL